MSPAHHQWFWAVSARTSAPVQSFEKVWPKLLSKCNRYCVTSLIHPQTYQNHHARWSCNHTAPSHSSNPPVLPRVLVPTSFCLICNHLTLHLHNWHLSARSWTAPNSYAAPEPPAMLLLPAAFESAAFLACLASFLVKTRNSNNATKRKSCSRQALRSNSFHLSTLPQVTRGLWCHHLPHSVFSH